MFSSGLIFEDVLLLLNDSNIHRKSSLKEDLLNKVIEAIREAQLTNPWFTSEFIKKSFEAWANALKIEKIEKWLNAYQLNDNPDLKVGVIMAGNIPLVGLHDVISVLVSGRSLHAKCSSKDLPLMSWILTVLAALSTDLKIRILQTDQLKDIDILIATGTNNSARYFDYYFKEKRRLIRKNRTSIALITGEESEEELKALATDVFSYFGMGCRNVTKLYVPRKYDLDLLFEVFFEYKHLIDHHKYANNYDYNKAVYLLNKEPLLENGFLLMKEDQGIHSPIAVLFYEYYDDMVEVKQKIAELDHEIQCHVGSKDHGEYFIPFGLTQKPELWDYADGIDTLDFLLKT